MDLVETAARAYHEERVKQGNESRPWEKLMPHTQQQRLDAMRAALKAIGQ
jgi:hypothetical protein